MESDGGRFLVWRTDVSGSTKDLSLYGSFPQMFQRTVFHRRICPRGLAPLQNLTHWIKSLFCANHHLWLLEIMWERLTRQFRVLFCSCPVWIKFQSYNDLWGQMVDFVYGVWWGILSSCFGLRCHAFVLYLVAVSFVCITFNGLVHTNYKTYCPTTIVVSNQAILFLFVKTGEWNYICGKNDICHSAAIFIHSIPFTLDKPQTSLLQFSLGLLFQEKVNITIFSIKFKKHIKQFIVI